MHGIIARALDEMQFVVTQIENRLIAIAHRAIALDPLDEPLSTLAVVAGTPRGQQVAILSTAGVL